MAAPAAGAATPLVLVGPTARAASPPPQTPGLTVTIRLPAATTGRALSVLSYGATPGRNSDDASAAFRRAINAARSGDEIRVPKGSYVFKRPNVVLKSGVGCAARAGGDHHQVHHQLRRFVTIADNLIKNALPTRAGGEGYGIMIGYPRSTNNRVINNRVEGPAMRHGVLLQYSAHHNLVESNTVVRTTYDAFDLHGEDEYGNELRSTWPRTPARAGSGRQHGSSHANAGPDTLVHTTG